MFASIDDVLIALEMGEVETLTPIRLRHTGKVIDLVKAFDSQNLMHTEPIEFSKQYMDTTVGRVYPRTTLCREDMPFINGLLKKKGLTQMVQYCYLKFGLAGNGRHARPREEPRASSTRHARVSPSASTI